ncbi:hypothetical protein DFH06DRAFT_1332419 [Mycena polygramma]|nr:hypothetical protein DFH06DRAFT_1332419 [Mycena polygramma]
MVGDGSRTSPLSLSSTLLHRVRERCLRLWLFLPFFSPSYTPVPMLVSTLLIGTASGPGTGKVSSTSSCHQATAWESLPFRARCSPRLSALPSPDLVAPASVSSVKLQALWLASSSTQAADAILKQPQATPSLQDSQPSSSNVCKNSESAGQAAQALLKIVVFSPNQDVGCIRIRRFAATGWTLL